ncbi:outer membrane protein [Dyadobacter sp. BE34]|uniref:Outer membrane protein n=1 Tax=Dyadobacter fermentans TaxID=94254 RepID=A0ABU1R7N0_9BACT|nr:MULTISPECIES: OmpH family outer membrane protein [Dyadobacter]MDR6809421.1 outer membrane protein [Dyadobacter fermentans]MDR7047371.1 outer membrane protein [Dyadobacter sp. BE242]MDR7195048.1 outer membrane protein [Dyadobacter sp. BE34]MDR7214407.1 outer membrane protein [Dyadobacter sp. BE31]MDR7266970.1 outer membrane protein [Dyadobacter sp. BE32]
MNNNTSLIWNVVLSLAVAVLFFLHFSSKSSDAGAAADGAVVEGRRTVYVQVDSLLKNYDFFKDTRKELENKNFQLENELTTKGRSLQNEVAFFQQRAATMTPEQARSTEAQLMKKQQDLVAYRDQSAQALGQEEAKKNEELYKNIRSYIDKYNKENGYEYVLGYSLGGGILFANPSLDVTQKIIDGLNKEYKNSGKAAAPADTTKKK